MKILTSNSARCLAQTAHNLLKNVADKHTAIYTENLAKHTKLGNELCSLSQALCEQKDGIECMVDRHDGIECSVNHHDEAVINKNGEKCACDPTSQQLCTDHKASGSEPINGTSENREMSHDLPAPAPESSLTPIYTSKLNSFTLNSGNPSHDLKRFLDVVGTEPKEARYWFKYFQKMSTSNRLFAVIQIEEDIIRASEAIHRPSPGVYNLDHDSPLNELCSYLGFLQRHDMRCIVVHGRSMDTSLMQDITGDVMKDGQLIADLLEKNGAHTRLMGMPPLHVNKSVSDSDWTVTSLDPIYLGWAQGSHSIPIISNLALTPARQLININLFDTTTAISRTLLPLKVMLVNMGGGLVDTGGKVIPNINLPHDQEAVLQSPWCTNSIKQQIESIKGLLGMLHEEQVRQNRTPDSALIITSSATLLTELFTHYGSGTFFKITEKIDRHSSLETIDTARLTHLIHVSFGRILTENFIDSISDKLKAVYISEGYSAGAIITHEPGISVPYLDKFVVRKDQQDNSVGRLLWERIHHDYPQLFWRSRNTNLINPWYFKRSEGSWSDGEWTVFWYGVKSHKQSSQLIEYALNKHNSFLDQPDTGKLVKTTNSSDWSALQFMSGRT